MQTASVQFRLATNQAYTLTSSVLNETERKDSRKEKKRGVLDDSKLFKRHKPQTYSFEDYRGGSVRTMSSLVPGMLDWQ